MQHRDSRRGTRRLLSCLTLFILALGMAPAPMLAQFASGSTGANGAFPPIPIPGGRDRMILDLRTGEVTFLPGEVIAMLPNVPAEGFVDGVLHFTTVDIPEGVTLTFRPNAANTPVTMLAQGDVTIAGTIDVSGEDGSGLGPGGRGGPGGFKGGNGEQVFDSPGGGAGLGPGGGGGEGPPDHIDFAGPRDGGGGGFGTRGEAGFGNYDNAGNIYGNPTLLPLIGGSGGGGGSAAADDGSPRGGGGGGGGGALLIAASTIHIASTGVIRADGGARGVSPCCNAFDGGEGSGGAIRLMADTITGSGTLSAGAPDHCCGGAGGRGRIRLEALLDEFTGSIIGVMVRAGLGPLFLPDTQTLRIVSVGGVAVPDTPQGSRGGVDIVIGRPGSYDMVLAASRVPVGTTIAVTAKPEQDEEVIGPIISPGLAGTLDNSTTTVALTFPAGGVYFLEARTNALP